MVDSTLWSVSAKKPDMIRKIYNAKAPQSGTSLNDKFLAGSDHLGNMPPFLLRVCQGAIAIQSDTVVMFMQTRVQKKERGYLQFIWRRPSSLHLEVYEYQREIFGVKNYSASANFVSQQAAKDDIEHQPIILETKQGVSI